MGINKKCPARDKANWANNIELAPTGFYPDEGGTPGTSDPVPSALHLAAQPIHRIDNFQKVVNSLHTPRLS